MVPSGSEGRRQERGQQLGRWQWLRGGGGGDWASPPRAQGPCLPCASSPSLFLLPLRVQGGPPGAESEEGPGRVSREVEEKHVL